MANPFDDDDTGYKNSRSGLDPVPSYSTGGSIEDEVAQYEREIEKYMQESLDSTVRSRQHLENSEQLGTKTAQDLLQQREKLERTERNLDEIQHTTSQTQRSLNSLKSIFGGLKNRFSKAPANPPPPAEMPVSKSATGLSSAVQSSNSTNPFDAVSSTPTLSESSRQAIKGSRWEAMDNEIDENLGSMSSQLSRLKVLGAALGDEVEDQNRMLDRIQQKADRNDAVVRSQDHQMKKLLGYKPTGKQEDTAGLAPKKK